MTLAGVCPSRQPRPPQACQPTPSPSSAGQAIAHVWNLEEMGFNSLLTRMLQQYDMKPVLTRPEHHWFPDHRTYIEVNVDIHIFNYVARRALHQIM